MPSIVSITNQSVQEVQNYFSMFGYGAQTPQTEETTSCGSGIIIGKNDTELLIVTNNHVVEDADTLSVSFVNNQVCKANIKGTDADNDLAVIAVPLSEIPDDTMSSIAVATMGDSDSVEVGRAGRCDRQRTRLRPVRYDRYHQCCKPCDRQRFLF